MFLTKEAWFELKHMLHIHASLTKTASFKINTYADKDDSLLKGVGLSLKHMLSRHIYAIKIVSFEFKMAADKSCSLLKQSLL